MSLALGATPAVAVDVALFTVLDRQLRVLVVELGAGALSGRWALPGGRVHADETLDAAARRELAPFSSRRGLYLEQLYTFGNPQRDPHDRVVSVAYVALIAHGGRSLRRGDAAPAGGAKYRAAAWRPVTRLPPLAYDHGAVVRAARGRLRAKLSYTNLVYTLLPPAFTLGELQEMYEVFLGRGLDRRNFRKKMLSLGLLRRLDRVRRGPHRPATLYAFRRRRPMMVEML